MRATDPAGAVAFSVTTFTLVCCSFSHSQPIFKLHVIRLTSKSPRLDNIAAHPDDHVVIPPMGGGHNDNAVVDRIGGKLLAAHRLRAVDASGAVSPRNILGSRSKSDGRAVCPAIAFQPPLLVTWGK
jgi:hypothetical protein